MTRFRILWRSIERSRPVQINSHCSNPADQANRAQDVALTVRGQALRATPALRTPGQGVLVLVLAVGVSAPAVRADQDSVPADRDVMTRAPVRPVARREANVKVDEDHKRVDLRDEDPSKIAGRIAVVRVHAGPRAEALKVQERMVAVRKVEALMVEVRRAPAPRVVVINIMVRMVVERKVAAQMVTVRRALAPKVVVINIADRMAEAHKVAALMHPIRNIVVRKAKVAMVTMVAAVRKVTVPKHRDLRALAIRDSDRDMAKPSIACP